MHIFTYDDGALLPILLIVAVYFFAKILIKIGIITIKNYEIITKLLAITGGLFYALTIQFEHSYGPFLDLIFLFFMACLVAAMLWFCLFIGISGAVKLQEDEDNEKGV